MLLDMDKNVCNSSIPAPDFIGLWFFMQFKSGR